MIVVVVAVAVAMETIPLLIILLLLVVGVLPWLPLHKCHCSFRVKPSPLARGSTTNLQHKLGGLLIEYRVHKKKHCCLRSLLWVVAKSLVLSDVHCHSRAEVEAVHWTMMSLCMVNRVNQ